MIFRELIQGGFGILMFQKCQVRGILPFRDFQIWAFAAPYKAITLRYTLRRNETVHTSILCLKQHSDTL